MHNTIDYSSYTDPAAKRQAAIADLRNWLSPERFTKIYDILIAEPRETRRSQAHMLLDFLGVRGYPVDALILHIEAQEDLENTASKGPQK